MPATEEAAEAVTIESDDKLQANDRPRGWGTVLLAEDDPLVREFVCNMLRAQGYTVPEASDGGEALALVEKNAGEEIHLLVADLVMPLMGGKELAERVRATYPEIKALFISGCCQYSAKDDDTLDVGVDFLAKPFRPGALVRRIQELLEPAKV